jgi:hypothetical protein
MKEQTVYKLTDADRYTRRYKSGEMRWRVGQAVAAPGGKLCTYDVIHAYSDPYIAVLMDCVHGQYGETARMMEARGIICADEGTKLGLTKLTPVRWMKKPVLSISERVATGILCTLEVSDDAPFKNWAIKWLSGEDRTSVAATAEYAARAAAYAAEYAEYAADNAAAAAAYAAEYAAAKDKSPINLAAIIQKAIENEAKVSTK